MDLIGLGELVIKRINRVSPSRYIAMQDCLLREVWTSSGNKPLLPPSHLAELGSVIHQLLEAAGCGQLGDSGGQKVNTLWDELVNKTENKMMLSKLSRHLVPLDKSVDDFEVRKLRACHLAIKIAQEVVQNHVHQTAQPIEPTGCEIWVEDDTGQVGGYIDRVVIEEDGLVLSDYKSGAVLDSKVGVGVGEVKQAYKIQLLLYAALYHVKYGVWPIRLEIVPLQGAPVQVAFDSEEANNFLRDAREYLNTVNKLIVQVEKGSAVEADLASPNITNCKYCLFRPACQAYWTARRQKPEEKWPFDIQGLIREITPLRNGKVCIRITEENLNTSCIATVRNVTDCIERHPLLPDMRIGSRTAIYGLEYNYRFNDYRETQNTVVYGVD